MADWLANAFVVLWLVLAVGLAIGGRWGRALAALGLAGIWAAIFGLSRVRRRRRR